MNREEFKMNLIHQFKTEPDQVMPLLIPKNRLNRGENSIYANAIRYYSDEYGLLIDLVQEQNKEKNLVQINFRDMADDERKYARNSSDDLTNKYILARTYYLESIRFLNQKIMVKLELFYLTLKDGYFKKEQCSVESELVYSFNNRKVEGNLTISKMLEIIETTNTLRLSNTYVDALYTQELENQFLNEISINVLGSKTHQELLNTLREMNDPSQYDSAATQMLKKIRELFPEKP